MSAYIEENKSKLIEQINEAIFYQDFNRLTQILENVYMEGRSEGYSDGYHDAENDIEENSDAEW